MWCTVALTLDAIVEKQEGRRKGRQVRTGEGSESRRKHVQPASGNPPMRYKHDQTLVTLQAPIMIPWRKDPQRGLWRGDGEDLRLDKANSFSSCPDSEAWQLNSVQVSTPSVWFRYAVHSSASLYSLYRGAVISCSPNPTDIIQSDGYMIITMQQYTISPRKSTRLGAVARCLGLDEHRPLHPISEKMKV